MLSRLFLTTLVILFSSLALAQSEEILRPPVGAGKFYPDHPDALLASLRSLYSQASTAPVPGRILGCIVPHSGYDFAGVVAASVFKQLQPGQYDRVIILAPSHFSDFEGCSIPIATAFVTPLGIVPLDGDAINQLNFSSLISTRRLQYTGPERRELLHEREYDIEVLLPFLQERLGLFKLIPILVGSLETAQGDFDPNAVAAVAEAVRGIMTEKTLLVASSDFTHFGNDFSFRPFQQNILEQIQALDEEAFRLIARRDVEHFQEYMEETGNTICGFASIHVLMQALQGSTVGKVVAYDLSARKTNNQDRSVSYGGMIFYNPHLAALPADPQPNPFAVPAARTPGAATSLAPAAAEASPAPAPAAPAPLAPAGE